MIDPAQFARVKELLLAAESLPKLERRQFISDRCGEDLTLRNFALSLLDQDTRSLDIADLDRLDELQFADDEVDLPASIGPYRVLSLLGRGGIGVVYRALQIEPIEREVAVKIIRDTLAGRPMRERLAVERQTLAAMEHPNIARILDAGEDEQGRPYLVMDLVRGLPLVEFCAREGLSVEQRLRLFATVCHAVQHAHQKGVLHRDLKPANILVVQGDDGPEPKIIDFGIAKITGRDDAAHGLTRTGQIVGTPIYMSPEQASGRLNELDTRSDIYSLGVVLFELLTGELPYELSDHSILQVTRAIVEQSPRSLVRWGTGLGRRHAELETIVNMALEKSPSRRYASASEFAADLNRFLASEPIHARPPSLTYQFQKLVARHKVPFALISALAVALVAFSGVLWAQLQVVKEQRERARYQANRAGEFQNLLKRAAIQVGNSGDANVTLRAVLDRIVRDDALEPHTSEANRASLLRNVARLYLAIGQREASRELLLKSLALSAKSSGERSPEFAAALSDLAWVELSSPEANVTAADSLATLAAAIQEESKGRVDSEFTTTLDMLVRIRIVQGQFFEAESIATQLVQLRELTTEPTHLRLAEAYQVLSWAQEKNGDVEGGIQTLRRALEILDERYTDHTFKSYVMMLLATRLHRTGRSAEALPLARAALAIITRQQPEGHAEITRAKDLIARLEAALAEGSDNKL